MARTQFLRSKQDEGQGWPAQSDGSGDCAVPYTGAERRAFPRLAVPGRRSSCLRRVAPRFAMP